jgi:hypothetical protein
MAIVNGYTSLANMRALLHIEVGADTSDDARIEAAVEAASRAIDKHTGRRFWQDPSVVARVYSPVPGSRDLQVDDISTATGLIVKADFDGDGTYETTYTTGTDYILQPDNAAANGEPWKWLRRVITGTWPVREQSIQVTAKFGWAAVPTAVVSATQIQASRLYKRREAPFGVAGSPELGSEIRLLARLDPDVAVLLKGYRRMWGAV